MANERSRPYPYWSVTGLRSTTLARMRPAVVTNSAPPMAGSTRDRSASPGAMSGGRPRSAPRPGHGSTSSSTPAATSDPPASRDPPTPCAAPAVPVRIRPLLPPALRSSCPNLRLRLSGKLAPPERRSPGRPRRLRNRLDPTPTRLDSVATQGQPTLSLIQMGPQHRVPTSHRLPPPAPRRP